MVRQILWITGRNFGFDLCQTSQIQIALALKRNGWQVTFLSPGEKAFDSELEKLGLKWICVKRLNIPGLQGFSFERAVKKKLERILVESNYELVLCDWRGAIGASKQLVKNRMPWILIDRGPPAYTSILAKMQWKHYDIGWKRALNSSNGAVVVSPLHREFIQSRFGKAIDISILPAAVDSDVFKSLSDVNVQDGAIRLVYHGRLDYSRGVMNLVKVCKNLVENRQSVKLRMFGEGTAWPQLSKISKSEDWMELMPKQTSEKVPRLLQECHIGLLPMGDNKVWNMASPLKMYEYAASSLVIVGTDIPAHHLKENPEWIKHVRANNYIEPMSKKIIELIKSDEISNLGEKAKQYSIEHCTWDKAISELLLMINNLNHNNAS